MGDPVNPFDEDGEDGRIHIGDLRPADIALIKSVASVAAAHAVRDTLTALGIDPSEPFAAQADMVWLRTTRTRCETAAGKAILAIIGLIVAGAAGAFWIGFKASVKFTLPLIMLLALAAAAFAHSWYPINCCSDHDCQPVKCEDILETKDGLEYDGIRFLKLMEHPSQDRYCHVCIYGQGTARRGVCVFTMQGT
jgi:hypothetical protein